MFVWKANYNRLHELAAFKWVWEQDCSDLGFLFLTRAFKPCSFLRKMSSQDWCQKRELSGRMGISIQLQPHALQEEGRYAECSQAQPSKRQRAGHESWLCHSNAVRPWGSYLTYLCLVLLSTEHRWYPYLPQKIFVKIKWDNLHKNVSASLVHGIVSKF